MLNNKGYTLVELLATVIILGIVMAVIIPNISGISTQNKITAYAEDAKKFKNTVEYMLRGDSTVVKPQKNGECVVVRLDYVRDNEFDNPPYGGEYLDDRSFVVMVKREKKYQYYVQLVEEHLIDSCYEYKGYSLLNYAQLEGNEYLNNVNMYAEGDISAFVDIYGWSKYDLLRSFRSNPSHEELGEITGCNYLLEFYTT